MCRLRPACRCLSFHRLSTRLPRRQAGTFWLARLGTSSTPSNQVMPTSTSLMGSNAFLRKPSSTFSSLHTSCFEFHSASCSFFPSSSLFSPSLFSFLQIEDKVASVVRRNRNLDSSFSTTLFCKMYFSTLPIRQEWLTTTTNLPLENEKRQISCSIAFRFCLEMEIQTKGSMKNAGS